MPLRFQFVNVSNPANPASSETRTLTHSHAIRQAHANERRLRMQRYYGKASQVDSGDHETTVPQTHFPGPLSQIPGNSRDPFSILPRSISSQEYSLLGYCTCIIFSSSRSPVPVPAGGRFPQNVLYVLQQLSYSVTDVQSVVPNMVMHCSAFDSIGNLEMLIIRDWVSLAIMDAEFLSAILLGACRHILRDQPDDPNITRMALQYRQTCIQALRHTIGDISSVVNFLTFAKSLALAFDEVNPRWN